MATTIDQILGSTAEKRDEYSLALRQTAAQTGISTQQTATQTQTPVLEATTAQHANGGTGQQNNGVVATTDKSIEQQVSPRQQTQPGASVVPQQVANSNTAQTATAATTALTGKEGIVTKANLPSVSAPTPKVEGKVTNANANIVPSTDDAKLTNVQLFRKWVASSMDEPLTPEQKAKEEKRRKRQAIFAAIGDGISAMSNLFFTGQYGTPNAYDPKNSMSAKLKAQWEKTDKARKENAMAIYTGYTNARKLDQDKANADWTRQHTLDREAVQDRQYKEKMDYQKERDKVTDEHWQKTFDQNNTQWEKNFKESVRQFNVTSSQSAQRINMEAQRLSKALKEGGATFTLGDNRGDVFISSDRLNAQTVAYIFGKLPEDIQKSVHGKEIMTKEYGIEKPTGRYEPPSTETMLVAIGMHASDPNVAQALQEVSGKGKKLGLE